jgi:ABC-type branched-subunit amino acid transport system ATPase component
MTTREHPAATPATPAGPPPLLAAVAVRKVFGATTALDGASLSVAAGEIVALMGPVVLVMTAASLPVLSRLMRPDGLRTE